MPRNASAELPRTAKPSSSSLRRTSGSPTAFNTSAFNRTITSLGVAAGARIANHELKKKPGQTGCRNGRHIGELQQSFLGGHPYQSELAAAHQCRDRTQTLEADRNLAGGDVGCSL